MCTTCMAGGWRGMGGLTHGCELPRCGSSEKQQVLLVVESSLQPWVYF